MKRIALTQVSLNQFAKMPNGKAELCEKRAEAIKLREKTVCEHDQRIAEPNGLIQRIGVALGEVRP